MGKRKSAFGKLALLVFFAIVIPAVIQTGVYFVQAERNIRREFLSKTNESMDDKAQKVTESLNRSLSWALYQRKDEDIYMGIDQYYDSPFAFLVFFQEELLDIFTKYTLYNNQIISTRVYTNNDTVVPGQYIRFIKAGDIREFDHPTYLNMQELGNDSNLFFRVANPTVNAASTTSDMDVSIICALDYYEQYKNYEKYMKFSLDLEEYKKILRESNLFELMFLTDDNGKLIVASQTSEFVTPEQFLDTEALAAKHPVLQRKIDGYPLYLYGVYSDEMISEGFTSSRRIIIGVIIASVVIALSVIYFGIFSMKRRVYALVEQSELDKIELEHETNKAKFLALQSQVNPHFMFNALESIRLKALVKGEKETAMMIKHMAKMFRNMINWRENIISLKEEITILEDFLHLQKYRFEDEFSYDIEVSKEARECQIPRMLLQPLVENASVHGIETRNDDRWIKLTADVEEGFLTVMIEDCGGGIAPERLEELRRNLEQDSHEENSDCVGLSNVYRRLRLYYGSNFSFHIDSTEGVGTKVTVKIPEVR